MSLITRTTTAALAALVLTAGAAFAQTAPAQAPPAAPRAGAPAANAAPERPHGFPPVNPADFTATHPSREMVEGFLHAQFGFDSNRIWQVQAIRKTMAPGISDVIVLLATRTSPDQIQPLRFLVTPDDKFALIGNTVLAFGKDPFSNARDILREKAQGPSLGPKGNGLLFVEFSDLQCPHCKAAQPTIEKLQHDYPNARFVYENFPIASLHTWATHAAQWGVCVGQQSDAAFFKFVNAVFDEQEQVTDANFTEMMKNAVTKAGADPAKAEACAASPEAAAKVQASLALGQSLGVDSTPTLFIDGRAIPLGPNLSYELLQQIIAFQAKEDGVSVTPQLSGLGK